MTSRRKPLSPATIDALLNARRPQPNTDVEHPMVPGFGTLAGGPPADECLYDDGTHASTEPGHDLCAACEAHRARMDAKEAAHPEGCECETCLDKAEATWERKQTGGV